MSIASITNRFAIAFVVSFATIAVANTASAQSSSGYGSHSLTPVRGSAYSFPGYGYSYHSSTAAEGFLRGKAAVIDSLGNFAVNASEAEILQQQARALDRENDLKQTAALHAQQKMWSDARIQARKDHEARAAEGRLLIAEKQATDFRQAYELPARELNLQTGEISWPSALQGERFEQDRTRLEELFRQHVAYGKPRGEVAREISLTIDRWAQSLRHDVGSMPREDYVAAQKFLLGLKYGAASIVAAS